MGWGWGIFLFSVRTIVYSKRVGVNRDLVKMSSQDAQDVIDRMRHLFGVESDGDLARILELPRSTVGNWRARGSVPYSICVDLAAEKGVSLDWLLMGVGSMYRPSGVYSGATLAEPITEAPSYAVAEPPTGPMERKKAKIKQMVDQIDSEKGLDAVQDELERVAEMNALKRRVAELEKKAG
jgi:hypothetical protein